MDDDSVSFPGEFYWLQDDEDSVISYIKEKVNVYHAHLHQVGQVDTWKRAHNLYYGRDPEWGVHRSHAVGYGGEQGELALFRVNHFRSIVEHLLVLITGQPPAYLPRALNGDYKAQAQAELAEGLVRYFMGEKGFEEIATQTCEYALLFGEGWLRLSWDPNAGEAIDADLETGSLIKTGDVTCEALQPIDVIRDVTVNVDQQLWHVVHSRRNKWNLAESYPHLRDDILQAGRSTRGLHASYIGVENEACDYVSVYELFHKRCDVLPEGLYCKVVGDVFLDPLQALPDRDYPLISMVPSKHEATPFGYSRCWDLMALQEGVDSIASDLLTIHSEFAIPSVWTPRGAGLSVKQIASKLGHIETNSPEDQPQLISLLDIKEDSFKLYNMFVEEMQTLVGVNNIIRGKSEENVRTAGQAALMSAEATQFNSRLERAWKTLLEKMATQLIRVLQQNATEPLVIEITGKQSRPLLKEFIGSDVKDVHKVTVDLGDPMLRTVSGKVNLVEKMVALANTKHAPPLDYQTLVDAFKTGSTKPVMDYPAGQRRLVDLENEWLLEGKPPKALITDKHRLHIVEHLELLNEPSIRYDDFLTAIIVNHVQEHFNLYVAAEPNMLAATGQEPPIVPPPVAGAVAGGPMPPQGTAPPPDQMAMAPGVNPGADNVPPPSPAAEQAGVAVPQPPAV